MDTATYVLPAEWILALEHDNFTGLNDDAADDVRLWRHYNPEVVKVEALPHSGRIIGSASSPHGRGPAFQDLQLCYLYRVTLDPAKLPADPPASRE